VKLIKLNAIDSTNEYIKKIKLFSSDSLICVYTFNQTMGKGRRANIWSSEPFMNLCVSFCYRPSNKISDDFSFKLNMLVSNKILEFLNQNKIPNIHVKWPNDILSDKKKIAGILIESSMKKNKVSDYIIGIGLNVNQFDFGDLKQASSLKKITNINYDLHKISKDFINHFSNIDEYANNYTTNQIKTNYINNLYGTKSFLNYTYKGEKIKGKIIDIRSTSSIELLIGKDLKILDSHALKLIY